jgi:hypothetical protein
MPFTAHGAHFQLQRNSAKVPHIIHEDDITDSGLETD